MKPTSVEKNVLYQPGTWSQLELIMYNASVKFKFNMFNGYTIVTIISILTQETNIRIHIL